MCLSIGCGKETSGEEGQGGGRGRIHVGYIALPTELRSHVTQVAQWVVLCTQQKISLLRFWRESINELETIHFVGYAALPTKIIRHVAE